MTDIAGVRPRRVRRVHNGSVGGLVDLLKGAASLRIWNALAIQEIRSRYHRSLIGPFWITLSMGVTVAGLGFLYAKLFQIDLAAYLPYLTIGFVVWGFISPAIGELCSAFISSANVIKQSTAPVSIHVFRIMSTNVIVFLHNSVIFVIVAVIFSMQVSTIWLYSLAAFALINISVLGIGLFLAVISTRFRDIPIMVSNILILVFFMTPILWQPTMLPDRALFLRANPFYYLVEAFRLPLLGEMPDRDIWVGASMVAGTALLIGAVSFILARRRIAYWL